MKEIPLTKGHVAQVDDEDYERLMRYKWHVSVNPSGCVYAITNVRGPDGKWRTVRMHRMIMNYPPKGVEVDHIDGDGRNNQKANLRLMDVKSHRQTFWRKRRGASSQFRGVYWSKAARKWMAYIGRAGKNSYIGLFEDEEAAARARDVKALELFGSHAHLNFPT